MLYKNQKDFKNGIVVLGFSKNIMLLDNVLFTNRNAAVRKDTLRGTNVVHDLKSEHWNWQSIWSKSWSDYDGNIDFDTKKKCRQKF